METIEPMYGGEIFKPMSDEEVDKTLAEVGFTSESVDAALKRTMEVLALVSRCQELEERLISVLEVNEGMLHERRKLEERITVQKHVHNRQLQRVTELTLRAESNDFLKKNILRLEKELEESKEVNKTLRKLSRGIIVTRE